MNIESLVGQLFVSACGASVIFLAISLLIFPPKGKGQHRYIENNNVLSVAIWMVLFAAVHYSVWLSVVWVSVWWMLIFAFNILCLIGAMMLLSMAWRAAFKWRRESEPLGWEWRWQQAARLRTGSYAYAVVITVITAAIFTTTFRWAPWTLG